MTEGQFFIAFESEFQILWLHLFLAKKPPAPSGILSILLENEHK
jgi:hypothetical protein